MLKKVLNATFIFSAVFASGFAFGQGSSCAEMDPICTDDGISFTAGVGDVSEPGNDYGCLSTQPNPSWYYLEISESGDLHMELYADSDIDFIIWGPFDDLADAISNCGTLGTTPESPEVDCSYSAVAYETPSILGTTVGEVYILLITNYAAVVQDITLGKIGGEAETDCEDVLACTSAPGTFTLRKNDVAIPTDEPIYLCEGDDFEIISNDDYVLPNDTIPAPIGDGIYTAQLMWLVYNAEPAGSDPIGDPGYMGMIIPNEDLADTHDDDSPIVDAFGCGTYYLVPVAGDDGVGDGGDNDNGSVTWDKDANGCYELGDAIQVTYACPIEADITTNCGGPDIINGIDFNLSGGDGEYAVVSLGSGNLESGTVPNGGTATVADLENGFGYEIFVTDEQGCTANFSGTFAAPILNPIVITPAVSCPDASLGNVDASIVLGSGNGTPYAISLNGTVTAGANADIDDIAGTAVTVIAVDGDGCITDSVVTITSAGHFIDVDVLSTTHITCFGDNNGSASISALPVDAAGAEDGTIVSITWTDPTGTNFPGGAGATSRDDMMPGTWFVTIVDDYGCEVTISIDIETPAALDLFVNTTNQPTCYGFSDGSIDLSVTGGTGIYTFSWKDYPEVTSDVLNTIGAGNYWGYVTDENGCKDSVEINLGQPDSLYADLIIKHVDCFGESTGTIVVSDVHNASGEVRYFWDMNGIVPNPAPTSNIAENLPAGTYLVTIQDEFCDNQYEITITENPELEFGDLGTDPAYCRLYSYQSGNGQLYAAAIGGVPDYEYLWTELGTGATSVNSTWGGRNPGDYTITITDSKGCVKTETVVLDSLNPEAIFTVTSDQLNGDLQGTETVVANFTNQSINFANPLNPLADTTFFWNFDYNNTAWVLSESLNEQFDTTYTGEQVYNVCLVAMNKNGCTDTTCQEITVYALPDFTPFNIFTPDGDNINDIFSFDFGAQGVETFSCTIVDRWGTVVTEFNAITDSWDGNTKGGRPCPDGVYFYTYSIVYTNATKQEGQGNIQIVRGQ